MRKSSIWAILLTTFFVGASIYTLYPSFVLYTKSSDEQRRITNEDPQIRKRIINLGLDLQGGMRLVLEVQRNKDNQSDDDLLDRAYTIVENRINGLGLTEPNIQKQGRDRLIVELPGLTDEKIAKEVLGSTAQLKFHILRSSADLEKAIRVIDKTLKNELVAKNENVQIDSAYDQSQEQQTVQRLLSGSEAQSVDTTKEEETSVDKFSDYLITVRGDIAVREKDKPAVMSVLARPDVVAALKTNGFSGSKFLWENKASTDPSSKLRYYNLYLVKSDEAMSGENIESAREEMSNNQFKANSPVVSLVFNSKGAREFEKVTARNIGERLAIVLDDFVYSAPTINEKIGMGRAQISGSFTLEEAKALAVVLQAGALPAPVEIVEERVIGPSLGYDSIEKASWATLIGLILVSLFMIYRYKMSGIIAITGVLLNILFVLGIMAGLSATLTLPGIAGIILLIGMAVDANVLIFERIKEELSMGKAPITAMEAGYTRAFRAIFDANITTVMVALILYNIGSGPVRGFALTMTIGILVSLYTALTFTKTVFRVVTASGKVKKLSI
ncbi:MAG: protein translocase subunit SecD [Chitinispirillales bacterium]|jgi:protein-export membrane protein SecD|nr:protein translocase subunit SecD [Chitinispirillales bacterium]